LNDTTTPLAEPSSPTISISEEMRKSYLDYAMSVIVSRALPDVRDGLKPVHRRPAFAQEEESLKHTPTSTHQKVRPSNRRSASRPSRPPQERFPSGPVPKWLRQSLWGGFT
jgi:hypothetical protein